MDFFSGNLWRIKFIGLLCQAYRNLVEQKQQRSELLIRKVVVVFVWIYNIRGRLFLGNQFLKLSLNDMEFKFQ